MAAVDERASGRADRSRHPRMPPLGKTSHRRWTSPEVRWARHSAAAALARDASRSPSSARANETGWGCRPAASPQPHSQKASVLSLGLAPSLARVQKHGEIATHDSKKGFPKPATKLRAPLEPSPASVLGVGPQSGSAAVARRRRESGEGSGSLPSEATRGPRPVHLSPPKAAHVHALGARSWLPSDAPAVSAI